MSQIWLNSQEESRNFWESSFVLANSMDVLSKYDNFKIVFPQILMILGDDYYGSVFEVGKKVETMNWLWPRCQFTWLKLNENVATQVWPSFVFPLFAWWYLHNLSNKFCPSSNVIVYKARQNGHKDMILVWDCIMFRLMVLLIFWANLNVAPCKCLLKHTTTN